MIAVGSGGTEERRWLFDHCPAAYLRHPQSTAPDGTRWWVASIDSRRTAFDAAAEAHWRYSAGHSIGDAPKLRQAVWLFECEKRAREALEAQAIKEDRERRAAAATTGSQKIVAKRA